MSDGLEQAQLQYARGHSEEAVRLLDAVLADQPEHLGALLLRAKLWMDTRDDRLALACCERAFAAWPRSAEALNGLARCLHALGRDEEALVRAQQARELLGEGENFRHTAPVYLTLLWCLRELRRYREAIELAEEGLARQPDAVLAQWASLVEEELAEAEKEGC